MRKGTKHKANYRGSPAERFWDKVEKTDSCWMWTGATKDKGYGVLRVNGKNVGAHVFSYELHKQKLPSRAFVCHACDTPACVNPEHLWVGDNDSNIKDMVFKNRHTYGERNAQAKLTTENVLTMKHLKKMGVTQEAMISMFGVSRTAISQAITGKRWKHLLNVQT